MYLREKCRSHNLCIFLFSFMALNIGIHSSIHPFNHLNIHSSIQPSIHLIIQPSNYPVVFHSLILSSITHCLAIHSSYHSPIFPFTFIYLIIHLFTHSASSPTSLLCLGIH